MEIADSTVQQQHALEILNALHREGFTRCWLESMMMFSGGVRERGKGGPTPTEIQHHHLRVIIENEDVNMMEMERLEKVAAEHRGKIILAQVRLNQQVFSRLAIWPVPEASHD